MAYLHKFFKVHSLTQYNCKLVGATCLFLAAKVHYVPVSLKQAVCSFFDMEKRWLHVTHWKPMTKERELIYLSKFERMESQVLVALNFEVDVELPYKVLKDFCES